MKWFYNFKISVKLMMGFILIAVIAGAVGIVGIINITKIDNNDTKLYQNMTIPITYTTDITERFQRIRVNLRDMIIADDTEEISARFATVKELDAEMGSIAAEFEKLILSDKVRTTYDEFIANWETYKTFYDKFLSLCNENKDEEAAQLFTGEWRASADALQASINELVLLKKDDAKATSDQNSLTADTSITMMAIIIAVGVALSLIIGLFISNIISKPVKKLTKVADQIAQGDLDVSIDINTKDEIGQLGNSFRIMSDNLNEVMSNIMTASEQVAAGSKQVSDSSMELSQGATEQASSIEELTASIEEIASQTKLNAENAENANNFAVAAQKYASIGNDQMNLMLKSMDDINTSSKSISKIIKVIDDIAFQTNILALNAAVEAARAGQHGKGFAVVAEEVRNLAARSANAAKETTDLIEGSINKVNGGTKIAGDTAEELRKIVDGVAKVAELVNSISIASKEQSAGVSQINQGIMQVSQVVQSNSATSEETAAASEELSGQAVVLAEQVEKFKIKGHRNSSSSAHAGKKVTGFKSEDTNAVKKGIALNDSEFGKY